MIDPPQLIQTSTQLMASLHLQVPKSEIRRVMGPGLSEVHAALAAQRIKPAGPWCTHHLRTDPTMFDFEICVPVSTPIAATGRVTPGEIAAALVARTVYHGNYDGLGGGWGAFMEWIKSNGHTPRADLWEVYRVGPEASPNPADWCTELNRPLLVLSPGTPEEGRRI